MPWQSTSTVLVVGRLDGLLDALATRSVSFEHVPDTHAALESLGEDRFGCLLSAAGSTPLSGVELAAVAYERAGVPSVVVGGDVPAAVTDVPGVSDVVQHGAHERAVECLREALEESGVAALSTTREPPRDQRSGKERALEAHEKAVDTAADGSCRLDENGRFVTVDDALCELTGYDREALLGRPAKTVFAGERDDAATDGNATLETVLKSAHASDVTVETTIERADGATVLVALRPSGPVDGGPTTGRYSPSRRSADRWLTSGR
ncbi:PAS domain-containing protein [Halomicroarcula sp. GCM10025817]|uniref:PAS domain-containing protein n=1 Tax=Haloarcula TaxID=2237 RepID=UPI0023E79A18|nr:PAS domain-containing protein [Halomicroarcula sp. SYNS111]